MLQPHPDRTSALFILRGEDGKFVARGNLTAKFGYRFTGPEINKGDGVWAQWKWTGSELVVENDRFGFLPVYYCLLPTGMGVSTSIMDLLQAGADETLNDEAVAVFLRLGYYVGNDNPFRDIHLLPPGSELKWSENGLRLRSTAPQISTSVSQLSRQQAVNEYGQRFQEVVESMLPEASDKMCVPLSAGRDSRHILYALVRAGRLPQMVVTAMSAPPRPCTDAQIASEITAALGLPHTVLSQSQDRFADELEKDFLTSFCADEHSQMVPVAKWLNREQFSVSWDGIAGDIFSCGVFNDSGMLDQFRNRQLTQLSSGLLADDGYLSAYLTPDYRERWNRELAVNRLSRELEQYADLPNPASPFFFYNRVRRELALCPFGMLNRQTHILAPYLSHSIFDLLINLPFEYFRGRMFHSEAIDQFYPELPRGEYISSPTGFVPEKRSRIWKFAGRLGSMALSGKASTSCIRRSFLMPRLAKAILNRNFGTEVPVLFSRLLVMLHLEQTLAGRPYSGIHGTA